MTTKSRTREFLQTGDVTGEARRVGTLRSSQLESWLPAGSVGAPSPSLPSTITGFNYLSGAANRYCVADAGGPMTPRHGTTGAGAGLVGPCLSLDGSSYCSTGFQPYEVCRAGDWTLHVRLKVTGAFASAGTAMTILAADRLDQGARQFKWWLQKAGDNKVYLYFHGWRVTGGGFGASQFFELFMDLNAQLNTWYDLFVCRDSSANTYAMHAVPYLGTRVTVTTANDGSFGRIVDYAATGANTNTVTLGGTWDINNGHRHIMPASLWEELWFDTVYLTAAECEARSGGYDPLNRMSSKKLILSDPLLRSVHQADTDDTANVECYGRWTNTAATPTGFEVKFGSRGWETVSSPTITAGTKSFSFVHEFDGDDGWEGTFRVRSTNEPTTKSDQLTDVKLGDVVAWGYESNGAGAGDNYQTYAPSGGSAGIGSSFMAEDGRWYDMADEASVGGTHGPGFNNWIAHTSENYGKGSPVPRFAEHVVNATGRPLGVVCGAVSGTRLGPKVSSFGGWGPAETDPGRAALDTTYTALTKRVDMLSESPAGKRLQHLTGLTGVNDAQAAATANEFQGYAEDLGDAFNASYGRPIGLIMLHQTSIDNTQEANVRTGRNQALAGTSGNVFDGGNTDARSATDGGVHVTTDVEIDAQAAIAAAASVAEFV